MVVLGTEASPPPQDAIPCSTLEVLLLVRECWRCSAPYVGKADQPTGNSTARVGLPGPWTWDQKPPTQTWSFLGGCK